MKCSSTLTILLETNPTNRLSARVQNIRNQHATKRIEIKGFILSTRLMEVKHWQMQDPIIGLLYILGPGQVSHILC